MWAWLADRLILSPSRHHIPCDHERRWVDWEGGRFETWVERTQADSEAELFVLKFPGTGGRAERSTPHPAECWSDLATEVWTVNPPGYGGSQGRASLGHMAPVATAAWLAVQRSAVGRPILVTGNSLGSMSAIYLAARVPAAGLLVRNPVPLRELVVGRFGRIASPIARQVPPTICPIRNAARAALPTVVVSSGKDRVVPPALQEQVISSFTGELRVLRLANADHADLGSKAEQREYVQLLAWLRQRIARWPGLERRESRTQDQKRPSGGTGSRP